jgi:hypothetical protein
MNYKLILLLIVALFIGANLLCGCCRYPIFDYIMGGVGMKEGLIDNKDVGTPGSTASVKKAESDKAAVMSSGQPLPSVVAAAASASPPTVKKDGFVLQNGLDIVNGLIGGGPPARTEQIPVSTGKSKEGMAVMGSDINEVQNGDIAGMWVTKANTYASEFGYGIINNTGSAYTADEPLKNGEMVLFAKNKFKPECCPAPYSSSTGCVCMTPEQINFLNTRGGNRTSDSGV